MSFVTAQSDRAPEHPAERLPLSALQHLHFCPRQCALIHIERQWEENRWTAEGRVMHDNVHTGGHETRGEIRTVRTLQLASTTLGLFGMADVVEYHRPKPPDTVWQPFPVEYKRGKPKLGNCDRVQLCAQAICLEEMHQLHIPEGALFYGKTKRRESVLFDAALREETSVLARKLHALIQSGITPPAVYQTKTCKNCSLIEICGPKQSGRSARQYLAALKSEALTEPTEGGTEAERDA